MTKERQHRLATGGGGPCPDADIDPNIAEVAPALLVEIPNATDSDTIEIEPAVEWQTTTTTTETPPDISSQPSTSTSVITASHSQPILFSAPLSPPVTSTPDSVEFSLNEKKLRVQILKEEHLNREKRANELHKLTIKHLEEKFTYVYLV